MRPRNFGVRVHDQQKATKGFTLCDTRAPEAFWTEMSSMQFVPAPSQPAVFQAAVLPQAEHLSCGGGGGGPAEQV